jgi:hypothetical protein
MGTHDLAVLLGPDYLDGITGLPMETLRSRRGDCQEVEVALSYLRRLVQGRLDIVLAALRRRADGEAPSDLDALVAELPHILSDRVRSPGNGRLPTFMAPDEVEVDQALLARLDSIAGAAELTALADVADEALATMGDELTLLEREVSATRRALFERIDAIQEEIVRRYKTGEATVDSLLT